MLPPWGVGEPASRGERRSRAEVQSDRWLTICAHE